MIDHQARRHARIVMLSAAAEMSESMPKLRWVDEVTSDPDAIAAYGGDTQALRLEATAIAEMVWPD